MSLHSNKELVRRNVEEIYNRGRLEVADTTYSPMARLHDPLLQGLPDGPEGVRQFAQTLRDAFPDLHLEIDELLAEGNLVAMRYRCSGTHRNAFLGIPPTSRFATISGITMHRIENDRIAETWLQWDVPALLRAMGVELPVKVPIEAHV